MAQQDKILSCICRYTHYQIHYNIKEKANNHTDMWNKVQSFAKALQNSAHTATYFDLVYEQYQNDMRGSFCKTEALSILLQCFIAKHILEGLTEQGRIEVLSRGLSSAVIEYIRIIAKSDSELYFHKPMDVDETVHKFTEVFSNRMRLEGNKLIDPGIDTVPMIQYRSLLSRYRKLQSQHSELQAKYDKMKKKKKTPPVKSAIDEFLSERCSSRGELP